MTQPTKVFPLKYMNLARKTEEISLKAGEIIFVLGANGAGKSGLMTSLYSQHSHQAKRTSAHRQTWLSENPGEMTHVYKEKLENAIRAADSQDDSRWRDDYPAQRPQIAVINLAHADNVHARNVREQVTKEAILAKKLCEEKNPLDTLNKLLQLSQLNIKIEFDRNNNPTASKENGAPYSIAQLSDGERNAILITADVLTTSPDSLLLIDEPERHLHRSIISPLLNLLIKERPDCAFVIATHDTTLPEDNPEARVLMLSKCRCINGKITQWDAHLITASDQIDEKVKQTIFGSRRTILFVEGEGKSLDNTIYKILFPGISVIPKGSCGEVERAVKGINSALALHWVKAIGLIDADDRQAKEIEELKQHKIYALPVYSVESIYYSKAMIHQMATKASKTYGGQPEKLESEAHKKIIECITKERERMCARVCERKVRDKIVPPKWKDIPNMERFTAAIEIKLEYEKEQTLFDALIASEDIDGIIARYPVRKTGVLDQIAKALKCPGREDYENAVRKLLSNDEEARSQTKQSLGEIATAIAEANTELPKSQTNTPTR